MIVIFIAGLGHSGSTLLDMLLASQKKIVGLGELDKVLTPEKRQKFLKKFQKYPCTCGKNPAKCNIWGDFKNFADANPSFTHQEGYNRIIQIISDKEDVDIIVDSSKNLESLKRVYHALPEIGCKQEDFYVIHLTKDVRNFIESANKSNSGSQSTLYQIYHWAKVNMKIEDFLSRNKIKNMNVGYEEVALSTEFTLSRILEFVGKDTKHVNTSLRETKGHILFGNNMRIHQSNEIYYDYRWFMSRENQRGANLLMPLIDKYNKKWVYSNVGEVMMPGKKSTGFIAPKKINPSKEL